MKTADACFKQRLLRAAAVLGLAFAAAAPAQTANYTDYCEIELTGCPQDYDGKELVVPPSVMTLSAKVRGDCNIKGSVGSSSGGMPAIMFLIDHTGSNTKNGNNPGNDVNGNRFRVTRALVDTIAKNYPGAQVGMAIFGEGLVLDSRWDKNLVEFKGLWNSFGGPNQSYLPIKALNAPAKAGGWYAPDTGATWLSVIRGMFNVPASSAAKSTLRKPTESGQPLSDTIVAESGGTNISIAFEAAIEAFAAIDTVYTPKRNRYIIFISDGNPEIFNGKSQSCDMIPNSANPRCMMQEDFVKGTVWNEATQSYVSIPTTYTVYLTADYPPTPTDMLNTMTANIKKNGYSESNPSSSIKALGSTYGSLLTYMMNNIVIPIINKSSGAPKSIVISAANIKDSADVLAGNATFNKRFLPMDTAEVTNVGMNVCYEVQVDSVRYNANGTVKDTIRFVVPDSLVQYSLKIRRSANAKGNWADDQKLASVCGSKRLDLLHEAASLVGKEIKANMDTLKIVFDTTGGLFDYDSVIVEVLNASGDVLDVERFRLARGSDGKTWTKIFKREIAAAAPGDGKLQHTKQDSVIVVFRNPNIPLDTLRVAVPYISNAIVFYDAPGDPEKANRLPGAMDLRAGVALDIYANIFDSDGNWDQAMTSDAGKITWTISPDAPAALTKDGSHGVFRTETAGTTPYTITATYTDGSLKISGQMTVRVLPGPAKYVEAVTDSTEINLGRADVAYVVGDKEFIFKKDAESAVFYAVLRDAYGNYVGMADTAYWWSNNTKSITADPRDDANSTLVTRHGSSFDDNLYVTVQTVVRPDGADITISNRVHISVIGESVSAVGPNPFVPGNSPIMKRLEEKLDPDGKFLDLYRPIVAQSRSGGGNGNEYNANGVLVTATAPRALKIHSHGNGFSYVTDAKAVIYDAVGSIVFRSKLGDIIAANDNANSPTSTFGFVWDGKDLKGKTVGWGTYFMQMTATMANGEKFVAKRMIGVKFDEGYRRWR